MLRWCPYSLSDVSSDFSQEIVATGNQLKLTLTLSGKHEITQLNTMHNKLQNYIFNAEKKQFNYVDILPGLNKVYSKNNFRAYVKSTTDIQQFYLYLFL